MNTNFKEYFEDVSLISLISFAANEKEYDLYNNGTFPAVTIYLSDIADDSEIIRKLCIEKLEKLIQKYGFEKVDFLETWSETVDFMTSKILEQFENENIEDCFFYLSK